MTKASDNPFPSILITEGTEPSAPAAGKQRLYIDSTTHKLKRTDSSGTDVTIESTGSGNVATDTIWDAAGDLAVGTGADTAAKLSIGANRKLLKSDGSTAGWAFPTFIGARAYKAASQTIANNTTNVVTLYDNEDYDTDTIHDNSSNTGRFTIPTGMTGYWRLTAGGLWAFNAAGIRLGQFRKNGTTSIGLAWRTMGQDDTVGDYQPMFWSQTLNLTAADYVEWCVFQNSGGNLNYGDTTPYCAWMEVEFVGL